MYDSYIDYKNRIGERAIYNVGNYKIEIEIYSGYVALISFVDSKADKIDIPSNVKITYTDTDCPKNTLLEKHRNQYVIVWMCSYTLWIDNKPAMYINNQRKQTITFVK